MQRRRVFCQLMWTGLVLALVGGPASLVWSGTIAGTIHDQQGAGAEDVVVFLKVKDASVEVAPSGQSYVMDQKNMEYVPHVVVIRKGESVTFKNSDALMHNVHAFLGRRSMFNIGIPAGGPDVTKPFKKVGEVAILCNVHPEMSAWVIVLEGPYFALSDEAGDYEISDVPTGMYTLVTWHEELGAQEQEVTVPVDGSVTVDLTLSQ